MKTGLFVGLAAFTCLFLLGVLAYFTVLSDKRVETTPPQVVEAVQEPEVGVGVEQVVIFYGIGASTELQKETNVWLSKHYNGIEITRVLQNQSGNRGYVTLSIFYKKTK